MKQDHIIKWMGRQIFGRWLCLLLPVVALEAGAQTIDSTWVNVPFGKQRSEAVTAALSSVSGETLRKTQASTLSNTLFGRLPGLSVLQKSGEIGYDEATLYLRGMHTFKDNGLLILLDGFEVDGFNQITPEEIESVTILKDAAALALYGMTGGNGAILITTRRGKLTDRKIEIGVKARYGIQLPQYLPEFKGSYDYARLYNEALVNDRKPLLYTEQQLEGYRSGSDPYLYPDVNWYDEILKNTQSLQDYTLTFNGGNRFARYFVMAGYMNSQGLYAHTDGKNNANLGFQRFNFRANVDIDITRSLSARVDLGGRIEDRKFPSIGTGTLWKNMATYAPNLYPVRTPGGGMTGSAKFPDNPVGTVLERGWDSRHSRDVQAMVRLRQGLEVLTPGLGIFAGVSFNSVYQNGYAKKRSYAYYEPMRVSVGGMDSLYFEKRGNDTDLTVSTGSDSETNRMHLEAGVEYERAFGEHEVGVMVMYRQHTRSKLGEQALYAQQSILGRVNYAFRRKYFAELSLSYNGTENYAEGHRFGLFPALSAAWLLSEETFLKDSRVLDFLKVRASAGIVGNHRGASRFSYNQYWGPSANQGYYFGSGTNFNSALVQLALSNEGLTWETSYLYNLGVESRWLGNRLTLEADVFYEQRKDILVDSRNTMPAFAGISFATMVNNGKMRNYGVEVASAWHDRAGAVTYFAGLQFAFARNEITQSGETPRREAYRYQQGHPQGQHFGLEAIGFFRDESDIANSPRQTFTQVRPGDLKYKDQNQDGVIDVNDEGAIGWPVCPEITYALNVGAAWKGFDLELLFQGNANRSVYLNGYMFWPFVDQANIASWAAEGRWTPERSEEATFPRLTTESNTNNYRSSDFWVKNVALLRLRNVEVGYTFGGERLHKARISDIRLYVSAVNLFTVDNLKVEVEPETLSVGYPTARTFTVGLNLNF